MIGWTNWSNGVKYGNIYCPMIKECITTYISRWDARELHPIIYYAYSNPFYEGNNLYVYRYDCIEGTWDKKPILISSNYKIGSEVLFEK